MPRFVDQGWDLDLTPEVLSAYGRRLIAERRFYGVIAEQEAYRQELAGEVGRHGDSDVALDLRGEIARCDQQMVRDIRVINRLTWALAETAWDQGVPCTVDPETISTEVEGLLTEGHPELR